MEAASDDFGRHELANRKGGREVEKDIILKQVNGDKRKRRKVEKFLLQYKETPEQARDRAAEACFK